MKKDSRWPCKDDNIVRIDLRTILTNKNPETHFIQKGVDEDLGDLKVTKKKQKPETTIYIGRTLPGLPQYTVFEGGQLPAHVAEMVEANLTIGHLIVPLKGLQLAREGMQTPGHILNTYSKRLAKE